MLGSQLVSLLGLGVQELRLTGIFRWASQVRSLPRVILVHVHRVAGADEVESHLVDGLALVQSDLEATLAGANALKVVLRDLGGHYVLHVGHSLQRLLVKVLRKPSDVDVDDLLLGEVLRRVVLLGVVSSERGGQEGLLLLLSCAHILVHVRRLPVVRGWLLQGRLAGRETMAVQRRRQLGLSLVLLVVVGVVLADLPSGVGVEPVARGGFELPVHLLVWRTHRPVRLVLEVVHVDGFLGHGCVLGVVGLLQDVGRELILPHLIGINLAGIRWLGETGLGIPAGVGAHG